MPDYRNTLYAVYRSTQYGFVNASSLSNDQRQNYRSDFADTLPSDKHARIADVGCGAGFFLQFLCELGYTYASGVDTSPEQVDSATQSGLNVIQGDALSFLETNGHFERIFMIDILEHFRKDEVIPVLRAALNALAPGGRLVLRTINASSLYGPTARYMDFTHELAFTESSLRQLLLATSFSEIQFRDTRPPFGVRPKRFGRWLVWHVWRALLKLIMLAEVGTDRPRFYGKFIIASAEKPRA